MANLGFEGIGSLNVTFAIDTAIEDVSELEGKVVTLSGDGEIGYGAEGDTPFGVVLVAETRGVATVQVRGFKESVPMTATAAKKPVVGDLVAVDGSGKIVKVAEGKVGFGKVISIDTTDNTATVLF